MNGFYQKSLAAVVRSRMFYTRVLIALVFVLALFSAPYFQNNFATQFFMQWVGFALIILCVVGRIYCSIFIAGHKSSQLVTGGPFSLVRNPLYVFSFLGMLGVGLQFGMLMIPTLLIILFCIYYPRVVAREEERLAEIFGQAYEQYKQNVPRWIPRVFKMEMPSTVTTDPRIVLKSMRDATVFFLAFPAVILLTALHEQNIIPTFFRIF